jgi:hypothetical protein
MPTLCNRKSLSSSRRRQRDSAAITITVEGSVRPGITSGESGAPVPARVGSLGGERLLGIGLPLLAMALWGTFRVPGDPGDAPVAARLALELVEFGAATWLLIDAGRTTLHRPGRCSRAALCGIL